MNFANVKSITIPEGPVAKILRGVEVLWEKVPGRIPSEYQEVEWISGHSKTQTSGAYLDLGFSFDTAATIYITFEDAQNVSGYLFGAAESSGKYRCMITINDANIMVYGCSGSSYGSIGAPYPGFGKDIQIKYKLKDKELSVKNLDTGETHKTSNNVTFTMTNHLYLFAQNYNGNVRCGGTQIQNNTKLKLFQYYDKNGDLICDLIPCYRKSDGVVGAYDTARKIFLSSVGNYELDKGADV